MLISASFLIQNQFYLLDEKELFYEGSESVMNGMHKQEHEREDVENCNKNGVFIGNGHGNEADGITHHEADESGDTIVKGEEEGNFGKYAHSHDSKPHKNRQKLQKEQNHLDQTQLYQLVHQH